MAFQMAKDSPQMNQASRVEMSNITLWMREELYGQIHHMSHLSLQKVRGLLAKLCRRALNKWGALDPNSAPQEITEDHRTDSLQVPVLTWVPLQADQGADS